MVKLSENCQLSLAVGCFLLYYCSPLSWMPTCMVEQQCGVTSNSCQIKWQPCTNHIIFSSYMNCIKIVYINSMMTFVINKNSIEGGGARGRRSLVLSACL